MMRSLYLREYLTREEESRLHALVKTGSPDERLTARNRIMAGYYPMVVGIAGKHPLVSQNDRDDAIQIGMLYLMRAVEHFDAGRLAPRTGLPVKFITYATVSIYNGIKTRFQQEHGKTKHSRVGNKERRFVVLETDMLQWTHGETHSYQSRGIQGIPDPHAIDLDDVIEENPIRAMLPKLLKLLKGRERKVIELRFGLMGDRPQTLASIGNVLGVSKERIRQIQLKAMGRLTHSATVTLAKGN